MLILAGGRGKRLNELCDEKNKCMISIKDKPLIQYILDNAICADVSEIIIVVGYKAEEIINVYGNEYKDKSIRYIIQPEQRGLVHAIECAKETLGDEDFILMLSDEFMVNLQHKQMIDFFNKKNLFGVCGVVMVEDKELIKKTYSIIQGDDNRIYRLIEKPTKPMNNIMGTGNCIFKNEILSYIKQTPINQKRGEKELPDLIQCAIDDSSIIKSFVIYDNYSNINSSDKDVPKQKED